MDHTYGMVKATAEYARAAAMDDLMDVRQITDHLKMCRPTIQRWCKEGKLPAVKIGKEYRVRRKDLEAWYESLRVAA